MEHHSNDIAWRETIGDSVYVEFDADGRISLEDLDTQARGARAPPLEDRHVQRGLERHGHPERRPRPRARPAPARRARVLRLRGRGPVRGRRHAPGRRSRRPRSTPSSSPSTSSSAGPRTPGLLVAHRRLFTNRVPAEPGGGTVLYTSPVGPPLPRRDRVARDGRHAADRPDDPGGPRVRPQGRRRRRAHGARRAGLPRPRDRARGAAATTSSSSATSRRGASASSP